MKQSTLLRAVIAKLNEPVIPAAASREILSKMAEPGWGREPVFAWLIVNYNPVREARTGLGPRLTWDFIADIASADGVLGSRGGPPNGNSMRRVWPRVCKAQKQREARKAEGGR